METRIRKINTKTLHYGTKWDKMKQDWRLYVMILPALLFILFFAYVPMPGLIVAFMKFDIFDQFRSPWVGLENFKDLFRIPMFTASIWNTLMISILNLVIGFPIPIIFALLLNDLKLKLFKRFVQTVSYLPHFLSWIAVVGIVYTIYARYGLVNDIAAAVFGPDYQRQLFLAKQELFVPNVILTSVWKEFGWSSIIYLAALTSIDPQIYEAAVIDGASRWKQIWYVTLPGIMPTAMMLLILALGQLFNSNFELIYGLQNAYINFEVISTVVYKQGINEGNYSLATAFGFVQGVVAFMLIFISNKISKKLTDVGIW